MLDDFSHLRVENFLRSVPFQHGTCCNPKVHFSERAPEGSLDKIRIQV
jgi:hypothetical protein